MVKIKNSSNTINKKTDIDNLSSIYTFLIERHEDDILYYPIQTLIPNTVYIQMIKNFFYVFIFFCIFLHILYFSCSFYWQFTYFHVSEYISAVNHIIYLDCLEKAAQKLKKKLSVNCGCLSTISQQIVHIILFSCTENVQ